MLSPCSIPIASAKKSATLPAALADGRIPPSPSSSPMICFSVPAQSDEQNEWFPNREVAQEKGQAVFVLPVFTYSHFNVWGGNTSFPSPWWSPKQPLPGIHGRQACPEFNSFQQGGGHIYRREGVFSRRPLPKRGQVCDIPAPSIG